MIAVRRAVPADAVAMSAVLVASITQLCVADHRGEGESLGRWLSNKTPDAVRAMLGNPDLVLYVAEDGGAIVAVGCIDRSGEVRLNYIDPAHRFRGVTKLLLADMEAELRTWGYEVAHLTSTVTARRFYRTAGWRDVGTDGSDDDGYPMEKRL